MKIMMFDKITDQILKLEYEHHLENLPYGT